MNMRDWQRLRRVDKHAVAPLQTIIPVARSRVICQQWPSDDDQRRQGAQYYISVIPKASWGHLAEWLYQSEENRAVEVFKVQLPKPKGNQCDCVACVSAVCSDSVPSVNLL